jgi:hypothetical protein
VAGLVAVCDIAVTLRPHHNAVDRIARTEGATEADDNLMIVCSRAENGLCRGNVHDTRQTSQPELAIEACE